jgi:hypothetical protein
VALIEIKSDFARLSSAVERIALALERIAGAMCPQPPASPRAGEEPRGLEVLHVRDDPEEWRRQVRAADKSDEVAWGDYGPRQNY